MAIDLNTSARICLQQKSNVAFDGVTPAGYASVAYAVGGVVGVFRARQVGAWSNYGAGPPQTGVTVQLVKGVPGSGLAVYVQPLLDASGVDIVVGFAVLVRLATDATGAITSKLSDVAAALAGFRTPSGDARWLALGLPAGADAPVRLHVTTDGTVTAPDAAPQQLAGGFDPTLQGSLARYDLPGGSAGGLFVLEANEAHILEQVLSSGGPVTSVQVVNVDDGLGAIAGEGTEIQPLLGGQVVGAGVVFDPATQAIAIQAPAGAVQVWVRRATRSL